MFEMTSSQWLVIASVVNAVTVIALVAITAWYAYSARRQANATEGIARTAEAQARAAEAQARAAEQSALLLLEQIKNQNESARDLIGMSLESAKLNIANWVGKLGGGSFPELPASVEIAPSIFQAAVERAQGIDPEVAKYMLAALHHMNSARMELEIVRTTSKNHPGTWQSKVSFAIQELGVANEKVLAAQRRLTSS